MHVQIISNNSAILKRILECDILRVSTWIISMSNLQSLVVNFSSEHRKKSQWTKLAEQDGWGITVMFLSRKCERHNEICDSTFLWSITKSNKRVHWYYRLFLHRVTTIAVQMVPYILTIWKAWKLFFYILCSETFFMRWICMNM